MINIGELEQIISDVLITSRDFENKRDKMIERLLPLKLDRLDWSKYFFFENSNYTRNAVIHNELFSLIILCWDKGASSAIHDHPCEGCWIVGIEGSIEEIRYVQLNDGKLKEENSFILNPGEMNWMHDSIGFHKVRNSSATEKAVTLHIYSPPFQMCKGMKEDGQFWFCEPKFYSINCKIVEN